MVNYPLIVGTFHSLKSRSIAYVVTILWPTTEHIRIHDWGVVSKINFIKALFIGDKSPSLNHADHLNELFLHVSKYFALVYFLGLPYLN